MQSIADLGYTIYRSGDTTLVYKAPVTPEMIPLTGPIGRPTTLKGRRQLRFLEPDLIIRELAHGGLFAGLSGDRFLSTKRSLREIMVSCHLIAQGVPTPEILGLRIVQDGIFRRIAVITRLVPQAIDLIAYLASPRDNAPQVLVEAGRLVKSMHALKVYHADLHLKNFLLDKGGRMWLLDLDKAWIMPFLLPGMRTANLRRFLRSCRKWQDQGRIVLPPSYAAEFLSGYRQGLPGTAGPTRSS